MATDVSEHSDHRHRHPRGRAARPVDVAGLVDSGATSCRTSRWDDGQGGGGVVQRRPAPRRRRGAGDGRLARAPAVPPAPLRRHRPGVVGRRAAAGRDGRATASRRRSSIPTSPCSTPRASSTWATPSCSWRASRRTTTSSSTSAPSSPGALHPGRRAAVLGPRRDARRDRALRRPSATRAIVFTQDPSYFGLPELTDRYWDPMWAIGRRRRACRSTSTSRSGDLDPFDVGHPDNGPHANYAAMGVSFFLGQRQDDRPADHRRHLPPLPRAQLRVGGERHRLDPVRPRRPRLAVAELRRATRSTPSTTCCRASTSAARSTAASGSSATPRSSAIEQLGADNILYETDFPHPTSMSPGPASIAAAPRRLRPRGLRRPRRAGGAQDPPRQRRPHLPPRLRPRR